METLIEKELSAYFGKDIKISSLEKLRQDPLTKIRIERERVEKD